MNAETKTGFANIAIALAAAQLNMGKALKDSSNPAFKSKYADLASVMDACMTALNTAGIAVIQPTTDDDHGRFVETIFIHGESGEVLKCRVPLIVNKNDMQGYGSAVTYARRYGLMSMAGIAPEDDDGNAAAKAPPPKASEALRQARADAVADSLPDDATPRQRAEGFSDMLISAFKACTGDKALDNRWTRDADAIARLQERYPDLHQNVAEAYDMRRDEINGGAVV